MTTAGPSRDQQGPPDWAFAAAAEELYDVTDRDTVVARAWELVREAGVLDDERHDEYDDPDQGGEA